MTSEINQNGAQPETRVLRIPYHVGIVMDGNGRWAQSQGKPRIMGHRAGTQNIRRVLEASVDFGIKVLTIYAFSTENWGRPPAEVRGLMQLLGQTIRNQLNELHEKGVQIRHSGSLVGISPQLKRQISEALELTRNNDRIILNVAFNYGGRAEIVDAVRTIAELVSAGKMKPDAIDERTIARNLYAPDMPDPDLMVRTSGEFRISNYLLWEVAYSELVFTDVLWPDFRREHLFDAIREFQGRTRRFGAIDEPGGPS